jgi:hypothetical protein
MDPNDQNQSNQASANQAAPTPPVADVQPQATAPTSAASFRDKAKKRSEGELVTLVSGNTLRIGRPSVNNLVKTGQLPSELANAAIKMQSGGNISDHDMKKYVEYNERIVKLSVVSPKIVDQPNYEADEISIEDLSDDERNEILMFVNGGLEALAKFRGERPSVPVGSDLS